MGTWLNTKTYIKAISWLPQADFEARHFFPKDRE
jgi:hypothetical protein